MRTEPAKHMRVRPAQPAHEREYLIGHLRRPNEIDAAMPMLSELQHVI
jgi:hypothetical protein